MKIDRQAPMGRSDSMIASERLYPIRRPVAAACAGGAVAILGGLIGLGGAEFRGEFIIPILIFVFGADIRTAGTASVLISLPVVLTGVARHWLTGHYRSQTMLVYLVLPMCIGSLIGATIGGYLAAWAPTDALRIILAAILAASAFKLWSSPPPKM
jgi:uncharacterized membrane protein YfcA